ncbi:MAG: hypothetical protein ABEI99_02250 [Halobaculum sp.]
MVVTNSLGESLDALRRNPILIVLSVVFGLLQLPSVAAQSLGPMLSAVVSLGFSALLVLIVPFVFGGMVGMAREALDGETDLGTFVESGKANYLRLLGAYVLFLVVITVLSFGSSIVAGIAAVFVGVSAASGAGGGAAAGAGVLIALLTVGIVLLVTLLPTFFVQFFAHAIVLDDAGVVGGFTRSAGLVRRNVLTVFGYFLVVLVVGLVGGALGGVGSLLTLPSETAGTMGLPSLSIGTGLAIQAVGTLVVGLLSSVFWPFSVSVYTAIRDRTVDHGGPEPSSHAAGSAD